MENQVIILHSKGNDRELLNALRVALAAKGFKDDKGWNDTVSCKHHDVLILWPDDKINLNLMCCIPPDSTDLIIPVSRNDFQTMFLLY